MVNGKEINTLVIKNDQRHGQGTYTHANGDKYEGGYKNNLMDGQGTYTYANGRKEVGEFEKR